MGSTPQGHFGLNREDPHHGPPPVPKPHTEGRKPPLTSTHRVRVHPASFPQSQPPIPPALAPASQQSPSPEWGPGACAVRGRSRVGTRPPPRLLSHKWEGATLAKGPRKGNRRGSPWGTIPRPWALRVHRARGPRSHPPAQGLQPWDRRWRRRRPCPSLGSVCKVSRREAPTHQQAGAAAEEEGGGRLGIGWRSAQRCAEMRALAGSGLPGLARLLEPR